VNTFRISPRAERDLNGIWDFIAENSQTAATRFVNRIEEQCRLLVDNPIMGRPRPEFGPDVRSYTWSNYLIYYAPVDDGLEIMRVVHGARNIQELF
jgi:toxin ParE1/3/4